MTGDDDLCFADITRSEAPDLRDILDALAFIWARLASVEAKVDDLDPGEDIG